MEYTQASLEISIWEYVPLGKTLTRPPEAFWPPETRKKGFLGAFFQSFGFVLPPPRKKTPGGFYEQRFRVSNYKKQVSVTFNARAHRSFRGRQRAQSADSAQGWDLLPAGLLHSVL